VNDASRRVSLAWEDSRIVRGMTAQLRLRRELLNAGHKPLGWKLAFGGPAARERLGTNAPLVGFLTDRGLLASGSEVSLSGWKKPAAEPEIAVHIGKELPAGADRAAAIDAIAGLGPAIELADVDHPSGDVEGTLARNIYQRHVILGRMDSHYAGGMLHGLTGRVSRDGVEIAKVTEFQALTGELIDIVRHTAELLAAFGEKLEAGQIIIAGSIVPPLWVSPGEELIFRLEPVDAISVSLK
jgi:2-keto-4-pentenoate hydratase